MAEQLEPVVQLTHFALCMLRIALAGISGRGLDPALWTLSPRDRVCTFFFNGISLRPPTAPHGKTPGVQAGGTDGKTPGVQARGKEETKDPRGASRGQSERGATANLYVRDVVCVCVQRGWGHGSSHGPAPRSSIWRVRDVSFSSRPHPYTSYFSEKNFMRTSSSATPRSSHGRLRLGSGPGPIGLCPLTTPQVFAHGPRLLFKFYFIM